jgi:hypothetical protein
MKTLLIYIALFIAPFYTIHGQVNLVERDIDWSGIELQNSDSLVSSLIKMRADLNKSSQGYLDMQRSHSHAINLNNDILPDLAIYWTDYLNENLLQIFINNGDSLIKIFEKSGQITSIEKSLPTSPLLINLNTIRYSSPPFLAEYSTLAISPEGKILSLKEIDYYQATKFPDEFNLNIPFKVKNDKYRLRMTPAIENGNDNPPLQSGNLIQELAQGDEGVALSSFEDQTGRIWWFAIIFNNIKKSPEGYLFVNVEKPQRINNLCFGWISSTYLEY